MITLPPCPKCSSEYTYEDDNLFICPECTYEWGKESLGNEETTENIVKDAHGTVLQDGDSISVIKDLKVKGSSFVVKVGTKVKNIKLVNGITILIAK